MESNDAAARRRNQGQMLRRLARIQREIHGAVESCGGVLDVTHDGVLLSERLFHTCFRVWRKEPLEDNPYACARLEAYAGGVRFYAYIEGASDAGHR